MKLLDWLLPKKCSVNPADVAFNEGKEAKEGKEAQMVSGALCSIHCAALQS